VSLVKADFHLRRNRRQNQNRSHNTEQKIEVKTKLSEEEPEVSIWIWCLVMKLRKECYDWRFASDSDSASNISIFTCHKWRRRNGVRRKWNSFDSSDSDSIKLTLIQTLFFWFMTPILITMYVKTSLKGHISDGTLPLNHAINDVMMMMMMINDGCFID